MKREKFYDFLFNWDNVERGKEFECKSKEYFAFLNKEYSEINNLLTKSSNSSFYQYSQGLLSILKGNIASIEIHFNHCNLNDDSDYLTYFFALQLAIHEKYLDLSLRYKNQKDNDNLRGQLRAYSDLSKGLKYLTESMAKFKYGCLGY